MCEVIHMKRNPACITFLPLNSDTMIHLQGDTASDSQISVPAALLVARSQLIRNILSAGHLPPAFSTPVIFIPFISVDILEIGEMLISGMASMDRTRLCRVNEVFKLLGIEDYNWMFTKAESMLNVFGNGNEENVEDVYRGKSFGDLDKLENFVCIESKVCDQDVQLDFEHAKIEIIVKLESEPKVKNPDSLYAKQVNSVQSCLELETTKHKNRVSVIKQLQVHHEGVKHASNPEEIFVVNTTSEANKDKLKKHTFSSYAYQEKYSSKIRKKCPLCPHCDKILSCYYLRSHIKYLHEQAKVFCTQCGIEISNKKYLSGHIRRVHNYNKESTSVITVKNV